MKQTHCASTELCIINFNLQQVQFNSILFMYFLNLLYVPTAGANDSLLLCCRVCLTLFTH